MHFYCNAFRYYHRIGNLIFSPSTKSSRVVKAFNTSTMIAICMVPALSLIHI